MTSQVTFNPSLNVFETRKVDPSIEDVTYTDVKPQTAIDSKGPYVFNVEKNQYPIGLKDIQLAVECKITKQNGDALALAEKVGPVNNVLHTLFSQVEVMMGDTVVTYNHSLYGYQAYIEELLYADSSEQEGRLMMQGFIKDKAGTAAEGDPEAAAGANTGLRDRRSLLFSLSEKALLVGRLHCDIFRQEKFLLEHVPLRITLHRADDTFCLMKAAANQDIYKITISDVTLMVPRVKIGEAMRRSIESSLNGNLLAHYNINRTVMQSHLIPNGSLNFSIPTLFRGRLPHTVVLAMVESDSRLPDDKKNPFIFEEHNLSTLILSRNNFPVNFNNGLNLSYAPGTGYSTGYLNLLRNTGKMGGGSIINHSDFRGGYNIFPFKVVPQTDLYTDASALNDGVLDVKITFTTPTGSNIDLIVLAQFNGVITVDKNRQVKITG